MTFLQQQQKLSRILGDDNTTVDDLWPATERKEEINEGEAQFAVDTKSLLGRVEGSVASQAIALPSDYVGTHILAVNNLTFTSENEMPIADYGTYINSGDSKYYYWTDTSGVRKINFISSNTDGQAYVLFYFRKPSSDLSADGDESPYNPEYHKASVYYAAKELLPKAGKFQMASFYENKYAFSVQAAKAEIEGKVKSVIKAYPDLAGVEQYDRDVQGMGAQW